MSITEWVLALVLGGILGMVGQGIRVIAGLKKVNDQALARGESFNSLFQGTTLGISLLIGFVAGALAILAFAGKEALQHPTREVIIAIIGAGYAGTDFIEGFIKKHLPAGHRAPPAGGADGPQPAAG